MTNECPQVHRAGLLRMAIVLSCVGFLLMIGQPVVRAGDIAPAASVEELEQRLRAILDKTGTPGMIGAIVYGDDVIWQGALGVADRETGRPVTHQTLFRIGSISKTFLSLAILKLVERGEVRLSDPIEALVPDIGIENPWVETHPVRLVHLLEHTAGLPDLGFRGYMLDDPKMTTRDAIERGTTTRRVRWQPGTRMAYSNLGPVIAALALENVTGQPFEEFVEREIFTPLGMKSATYSFNDAVASSYDAQRKLPYRHIMKPSGGVSATSGDMIQLLRMFNQRGTVGTTTLLQPSSITRMETPTTTLAAEAGLREGYGLGNETIQRNGFVFQGHGGSVNGFYSRLVYIPHAGRGYFRSINARNTAAIRAIDSEIIAFMTKDLVSRNQPALVKTSAEELRAFEGTYLPDGVAAVRSPGLIHRLRLTAVRYRDGSLYLAPSGSSEVELKPAGNNLFFIGDDPLPSVAFVTSSEGDLLAQTGQNTWRRVSPWIAYATPVGLIASGIVVLTTLLFAPVWGFRWLIGRLRGVRYLSVRVLPLMTIMPLMAMPVFMAAAGPENLARPSVGSVGVYISSLLFAGLAGLSMLNCLLRFPRRREVGRFVWYHSLLASLALMTLATIFASIGLIGYRTWTL